jgi:hypothetical protein
MATTERGKLLLEEGPSAVPRLAVEGRIDSMPHDSPGAMPHVSSRQSFWCQRSELILFAEQHIHTVCMYTLRTHLVQKVFEFLVERITSRQGIITLVC